MSALLISLLAGCAVHVHDDAGDDGTESCSVHCGGGSGARAECEKPKIPTCRCEPEVVAACVSAQLPRRTRIL